MQNTQELGMNMYTEYVYIYIKMHEFWIIGSNINVGMGQNWVITTIEWFI